VIALIKDGVQCEQVSPGEKCIMLTDRTCFYSEAGGQAADTGNFYKVSLVLSLHGFSFLFVYIAVSM